MYDGALHVYVGWYVYTGLHYEALRWLSATGHVTSSYTYVTSSYTYYEALRLLSARGHMCDIHVVYDV